MLDMRVEDYRISSDGNQVIVEKARRTDSGDISILTDKKTGEKFESRSIVGYYRNLSKALVGIQADYLLSEGTVIKTIQDYRKAIDDITNAFHKHIGLVDAKSLATGTLSAINSNTVGTVTSGTIKGADVL